PAVTAPPDQAPFRASLVDDQEMGRAGSRMLADSQPDMVVVGAAGDGGQALAPLAVTAALVGLLAVPVPRVDGVGATRP
ncbi:DNA-binding response regulator, partial [Nocardioides sp. Y6]|nr:DNA-binding response regulator [Nocardioides malaquae]